MPDTSVTAYPPALTKGTQGATGHSVQALKDAGRVAIAWTLEFAPAAAAEAMATMTESRDGGAVTTFTSKVITAGKRLRLSAVVLFVENTLGANPKRARLRLRVNTAGVVTTGSPPVATLLAGVGGTVNSVGTVAALDVSDGIEFAGDGTAQIGVSLAFPDWVSAAQTGNVVATIVGFEY